MKQNILVAYDFTKASDIAVEHALMTAERFGFEVHLVHIIEDSKDLEKTENKFKKIPNYDKVICHVRIGDIFEDIVNFSYEIHSKYTVLGIHNLSLWQKYITGSDVLKKGIPENKFSQRYIRKFFNEYSISHTFEIREEDFDESIPSVAKETGCSLITIVNETNNTFLPLNYTDEQSIILNRLKLPVLVVNPIKRISSYWD